MGLQFVSPWLSYGWEAGFGIALWSVSRHGAQAQGAGGLSGWRKRGFAQVLKVRVCRSHKGPWRTMTRVLSKVGVATNTSGPHQGTYNLTCP